MKKKLLAISSIVLGAVTLFASTGCVSTNVSKVLPEKTVETTSLKILTGIDGSEDTTVDVNHDGIALITTKKYSEDKVHESTDCTLYNVQTGSEIIKVNFKNNTPEDGVVYSNIQAVCDGFYVSTATYYSVELEQESVEYTLYDKTGKKYSGLKGAFNDSVFVAEDGARYYLNVKGEIAKEASPLVRICEQGSVVEVGDYYVGNSGDIFVFDSDGVFLRALNFDYALGLTETSQTLARWTVGQYAFVQYRQILAEDAEDYDFLSNNEGQLQKYDLITVRYDVEKDTLKEIEFDYVVNNVSQGGSWNDESIIMRVHEIKDKQLLTSTVLQSFDEDGDVATDLQKLVPGASNLVYMSETTLVLSAAATDYVIQGKKVINSFPTGGYYQEDMLIYGAGTNRFFYELDGALKKSFSDVQKEVWTMEGDYIVKTKDKVIKYDVVTNQETVLCRYDKDEEIVSISSYCVYVVNEEDEKIDVYSLVTDIPNRLDMELGEENVSFNIGGYYYIEINENTTVYGRVIEVKHTNEEGTTITYYNYSTHWIADK